VRRTFEDELAIAAAVVLVAIALLAGYVLRLLGLI